MTTYVISSGVTSTLDLASGDALLVKSGGTSLRSVLSSGSTETVSSGGRSLSDTVRAGAIETVLAGGAASHGVVGGKLLLEGAVALSETVVAGGEFAVRSGATLLFAAVSSGGSLHADSGGVASRVTVSSGGELLESGGTVVSAQVKAGGVISVATLAPGATSLGTAEVFAGGDADFASLIIGGGAVIDYGVAQSQAATVEGTTVDAGGLVSAASWNVASRGTLSVGAGEVLSDATFVSSGGVLIGAGQSVGSETLVGGLISDVILGIGASEVVYQGQSLSQTVRGGFLQISGGSADDVSVASGWVVQAGGAISNIKLGGDGANFSINSGSASNIFVDAGAKLSISGYLFLSLHARDIVSSSYYAYGYDVHVTDNTVEIGACGILSGGTLTDGAQLQLSGTVSEIYDSGLPFDFSAVASSTDVAIGRGCEEIDFAEGQSDNSAVLAGGQLVVEDWGSSVDDQIRAGGEEVVSGGSVLDCVVSAGGLLLEEQPDQDGYDSISGAIVSSAGSALLLSATVTGGVLDLGAAQRTEADLTALTADSGARVTVSGNLTIASGGTVSLAVDAELGSATVNLGGVLKGPGELGGPIESAITATDLGLVSAVQLGDSEGGYGVLVVSAGGSAVDVRVVSGEVVLSGGAARRSIIGSGSDEVVWSGSSLSGSIAGRATFFSGAVSLHDVVVSGGAAVVLSGASVRGMTISSGGTIEYAVILSGVSSASEAVAATRKLGGVTVLSGGVIGFDDPEVTAGGVLLVHSGGIVDSAWVTSGGAVEGPGMLIGYATVSGGSVSGVEVTGSGFLDIYVGRAVGVRVGGADGSGFVDVEATASAMKVSNGVLKVDATGAVANGTVIYGGEMEVVAGASALGVAVSSGGLLVLSGGVGSAVTVHAGGVVSGAGLTSGQLEGVTQDGGLVTDQAVTSGGVLQVLSAGSASLVQVNSGGAAVVSAGGVATDVVAVAGGTLTDNGAAFFDGSNTLLGALSGVGELMQSGPGTLTQSGDASGFSGLAIISGGTIVLGNAGGLGTAVIKFDTASSTLLLTGASQPANGATFAETLLNFDKPTEDLDLRGQAFVAGATATLTGHTLALVDGTYSASFTLSGASISSFASAYLVTSDGHGGTLITAGASMAMAQRMAAFATRGAAVATVRGATTTGGLLAPLAAPRG